MEEEALIPWRGPQPAHCGIQRMNEEEQKYRRHIFEMTQGPKRTNQILPRRTVLVHAAVHPAGQLLFNNI